MLLDEFKTVSGWLHDGLVQPGNASIDDLSFAVTWLGEYECADSETAHQLASAMRFLSAEITRRQKRQQVKAGA